MEKTGHGNGRSEEDSLLELKAAGDGASDVNLQAPAGTRSSKRKNLDSGVESSKPTAGVKKRNMRGQEATADGNDSPSSPLNVRSSDDDFE